MTLMETLYTKYHKRTVEWLAHRIYIRGGIDIENARDQANDYVQNAWCQLLEKAETTDRGPGLLMTVSKRAWFESLRQDRIRLTNYTLVEPPRLHAYISTELRHIIETLPPGQLEVWYLHCGKGLTHQQIADDLRLAHKHASCAVLSKARKNLRKEGIAA